MGAISDVFVTGQDQFGNYRIPSILNTNNNILLAFAEARKELNDHAENKIVLKRSLDGGITWEGLQIIADAGRDSLNNPMAVEVLETGKIILVYQHYPFTGTEEVKNPNKWKSHKGQRFPPNIHEAAVQTGYQGTKICRTFMTSSSDEGRTWSPAVDITMTAKRPMGVTSYAGGPGLGIQVRTGKFAGRIILPFSQGPWTDMKVYTLYSDDQGITWKRGETAPNPLTVSPNEVQVVDLSDGKIMLNARTFRGKPYRIISCSNDGGHSWSGLAYDTRLKDPGCQGSILRLTYPVNMKQNIILFSNPASKNRRINGTVRLSLDDGKTWKYSKTFYKGSFAYSCLAKLTENEFCILFERDNYCKISFSRLDINWLKS